MAISITTAEKTEMKMSNNIMMDGKVIKVQEYKIDSDNPYNYNDEGTHFEYGVTADDKATYMANKAEFRKVESAFEDKVFAKIAEMVAQNQAK